MEDLHNTYLNYCDSRKILDIEFLNKYANELLELYNARKYLKNIIIFKNRHSSYFADYLYKEKIIDIYINNIKSDLILGSGIKFNKNNKVLLEKFNRNILFSLSHECFHAVQKAICNSDIKNIKKEILIDSFKFQEQDKILYTDNYRYVPIENNAEINSLLYTTDFINNGLYDNEKIINNQNITEYILDSYITDSGYTSPTEIFYAKLYNKDKLDRIMKLSKELSNFEKIIYSLRIEDDVISTLEEVNIGKIKVLDMKDYLEKI
ncbi:MAG TPA: hypothetical protein PLV83_04705 [Bacilli bacterium]|nr:hypothetical protein [Bacilli bacterium]